MNPETIAQQARKSISDYCINECKAYCCCKGFLIFTPKQIMKMPLVKRQEFLAKERLTVLKNGNFSFNLSPNCSFLTEDHKCSIHTSKLRPSACREFPLFIAGNTFRLSSRCPAVREGKFYVAIHKLTALGMKLHKGYIMADSDYYSCDLAEITKK